MIEGDEAKLSEDITLSWRRFSNWNYWIITSRLPNTIAISFDWTAYDAGGFYVKSFTYDSLSANRWDRFIPPGSSLGYLFGNQAYAAIKISNVRIVHKLDDKTRLQTHVVCLPKLYDQMVITEPPLLHTEVSPSGSGFTNHVDGVLKNLGNFTPKEVDFKGTFRNKGIVVGVFVGGYLLIESPFSPVPPPGEKVRFRIILDNSYGYSVPDQYDTLEVVVLAWNGCV